MKQLLFKDEMVQQILADCKTQTRRTHKKQKYFPGEIVYVAETYYPLHNSDFKVYRILYKADTPDVWQDGKPLKWKSKMFMPEKYSRIKLKITGAKKQKVKDITEAEAIAEGFEFGAGHNARQNFWFYFAQINKTPCDDALGNTEVWAYSFEVVEVKK